MDGKTKRHREKAEPHGTRAGVRRKKSGVGKSVRAGTDQTKRAGAPGNKAVRAVNCHVRASSIGESVLSGETTGISMTSVCTREAIRCNAHTKNVGAVTWRRTDEFANSPPSMAAQLSAAQTVAQPVSADSIPCSWSSRPAVSNPQCTVAGSQRTASKQAMNGKRRRMTGRNVDAGDRVVSNVTSTPDSSKHPTSRDNPWTIRDAFRYQQFF
jgi:hypothetical protein